MSLLTFVPGDKRKDKLKDCIQNVLSLSPLPTKILLVKTMVFPVVMYGCESWPIKKDERRRIDAFELWCSKEISPECSLKGLMLKLKLQYFGHPMQRANSFEKTLMLGKVEVGRRRG